LRSLTESSSPKRAAAATRDHVRSAEPSATWRLLIGRVPSQIYPAACLAAVSVAIIVNASFFQRSPRTSERPAPAVSSDGAAPRVPPGASSEITSAANAPIAASASVEGGAVLPPVRPARAATPLVSAATPSDDVIADLINGAPSHEENRKLVMAAQSALAKLGYALKIDGDANASTMQALGDYERRRNLAGSPTITPRVVKMLVAAANSSAQ